MKAGITHSWSPKWERENYDVKFKRTRPVFEPGSSMCVCVCVCVCECVFILLLACVCYTTRYIREYIKTQVIICCVAEKKNTIKKFEYILFFFLRLTSFSFFIIMLFVCLFFASFFLSFSLSFFLSCYCFPLAIPNVTIKVGSAISLL